jgi:hypothetical protein
MAGRRLRVTAAQGFGEMAGHGPRETAGESFLDGGGAEVEAAAGARALGERRTRVDHQDQAQVEVRRRAERDRSPEFAGIEWSSEALA